MNPDAIENLNAQAPRGNAIGQVVGVEPRSFAARAGVQAGDELLAINGQPCQDVIDVQFYGAEDHLTLKIRRDGAELLLKGRRREGEMLGIQFKHPTFDIDIRRCNNVCPFCFVLQMGPRFRRTLYIKDDDYRYSFLFGHYVTLTNLAPTDWERIKQQRLSPLYVSVHATDLEKRRQCLGNPTAPDVLAQLRELAAHHFEIHTQLVVTPGMNDGAFLTQSIRELGELYPTVASISVVPVGLTRFHKYGYTPLSTTQAGAILAEVENWQAQFLARYGVRLVYCTDEFYLVTGRDFPPLDDYDDLDLHENGLGMVRAFLDEWATLKETEVPTLQSQCAHITLATGTLAAPVLQAAAAELAALTGVRVDVLGVVNQKLGESITVAGLLMGEDMLHALQAADLGAVVVLPRIMFDHPDGVSLDDVAPAYIAQQLGKPVALADSMGDVLDVLTGVNKLTFAPDAPLITPNSIVQAGGWSVEKYL